MACHLFGQFGAKSLPEPILTFHQLDPLENFNRNAIISIQENGKNFVHIFNL